MAKQSPIFVKTEAFMVWLFDHTAKFPRHERFRLAKRIDDALFNFHEYLVRATLSDNPKRELTEADAQLTLLRTYLRIAVEQHYTSPAQFKYIAEHTTEIGKLLGGWLKKES